MRDYGGMFEGPKLPKKCCFTKKWNPIGFIPIYFLINILYLVGMKEENSGRIAENYEEIAKREKVKFLIKYEGVFGDALCPSEVVAGIVVRVFDCD